MNLRLSLVSLAVATALSLFLPALASAQFRDEYRQYRDRYRQDERQDYGRGRYGNDGEGQGFRNTAGQFDYYWFLGSWQRGGVIVSDAVASG